MKRILSGLVLGVSLAVSGEGVLAANPQDVEQLKITRSCPNCNLGRVDLEDADLRGADLRGANLYAADLRGANLKGADLKWCGFEGVRIWRVRI